MIIEVPDKRAVLLQNAWMSSADTRTCMYLPTYDVDSFSVIALDTKLDYYI